MLGNEYDPEEATEENLKSRLQWLKDRGVPLFQSVKELNSLFVYFRGAKRPASDVLVELGSAHMGSLYVLAGLVKQGGLVISIDTGKPKPHKWRKMVIKSLAGGCNLRIIEDATHRAVSKVQSILGKQRIDHLHIDAGHHLEAVQSDYEDYGPLVKDGGIIQFHDICDRQGDDTPEVHIVWNKVKTLYPHKEFIDTDFSCPDTPGNVGIGVLEMRTFIPLAAAVEERHETSTSAVVSAVDPEKENPAENTNAVDSAGSSGPEEVPTSSTDQHDDGQNDGQNDGQQPEIPRYSVEQLKAIVDGSNGGTTAQRSPRTKPKPKAKRSRKKKGKRRPGGSKRSSGTM